VAAQLGGIGGTMAALFGGMAAQWRHSDSRQGHLAALAAQLAAVVGGS